MNIAIFTDTFYPKIDGIVSSILNTAQELLRRGHKVMIIAPKIRPSQEELIKKLDDRLEVILIKGIKAMFYPDYRITPPVTPWMIKKLKQFQADVIHFHTPFTIGLEAVLCAKAMGLPLVSTFHTYFIEPEYLKIVKLHWVPGLVQFGWHYSNFFHDRCDMTLSPSQFTADELKRKKMRSPLMVLSNGILLKKARVLPDDEKEKIRKKYGLKEDVMLFIGRVSEEKCLDVLLNAGKLVFEKRPESTLLIVGGGPAFERIKELAKELGIEENVVFTGPIPHKKLLMSGIFEESKFFVTASTSENQPMTIIESCMFGLPIIGVNAKGVPEMIDGNGFVAEPGNHEELASYMLQLLEDNEMREKFSKRSLERGIDYNIVKTTEQLLTLYESLIEKKKRKPGKN